MRAHCDDGFTLIEMIVSIAIIVIVTGAILDLINPAYGIFQAQPESSDMQQRLRAGATQIGNELMMAGAGPRSKVGSLRQRVASVLPYRRGSRNPDPPGSAFSDRVSILYVAAHAIQGATAVDMAGPDMDIPLGPQLGCPMLNPICHFEPGMTAAIFDETGAFDVFEISGVIPGLGIQHAKHAFSKTYAAESLVSEVTETTYWLKASTLQLMKYDGHQTDHALADDVVDLRFDYYGEPRPPAVLKDLSELDGPWTSYGPKPPAPGEDDPATLAYGPGENCVFTVVNGKTVPRPDMPLLAGAGESLVKLEPAEFVNGPWCPDPSASTRFDADLLRIRRVRVLLRVQAGADALRGLGRLFRRAGGSQGGARYLPDQEIVFDVLPRNLNLDR